ncbi:MAG: hypothetical protein HY876_10855 [Coriobacteriales bacterium]|nr:hypothetical protein [Coriobacteriales bacterium]
MADGSKRTQPDRPGHEDRDHEGVVDRIVDEVRDEEQELEDRLSQDRGVIKTDNYFAVFMLILTTLVGTSLFTGGSRFGSLLLLALQSLTLIVALRVSKVRPRTMLVGSAIVALTFLSVTAATLTGVDRAGSGYTLVMIALVALVPPIIARRLFTHERITIQTVYGALSIYLLLGLFFAVVDSELDRFAGPFFVQTTAPAASDFLYYSFVTLTTTGYGDFTAATGIGRLISVTEALLGQIYLVTVIALLVGHIGKEGPAAGAQELREMRRGRWSARKDKRETSKRTSG